jgi:hypothetical protein
MEQATEKDLNLQGAASLKPQRVHCKPYTPREGLCYSKKGTLYRDRRIGIYQSIEMVEPGAALILGGGFRRKVFRGGDRDVVGLARGHGDDHVLVFLVV